MSLTVYKKQSPFDRDTFTVLAQYMRPRDTGRFARVCKEWNHLVMITDPIWRRFSEQEGIPHVVRANSQPGAARMDYMTLRSRMIS